jgi:hypothetical protein
MKVCHIHPSICSSVHHLVSATEWFYGFHDIVHYIVRYKSCRTDMSFVKSSIVKGILY